MARGRSERPPTHSRGQFRLRRSEYPRGARSMSKKKSRINLLRPLAGLLATGLAVPAFANPSEPFPTYVTGPQPNGSWVVGSGQVITPAGTQVDLGIRIRANAAALHP